LYGRIENRSTNVNPCNWFDEGFFASGRGQKKQLHCELGSLVSYRMHEIDLWDSSVREQNLVLTCLTGYSYRDFDYCIADLLNKEPLSFWSQERQ
jgi:hypothetical protein